MFKDYFRRQMSRLMHKILEDVCDPDNDCEKDTKYVTNLKNIMDIIKGLNNSWFDTNTHIKFVY